MDQQYSRRSPAVKRLMKEAQELKEPTEQCYAQPLDDNLFEWHFTVRGPPDSDFQGGVYHGRITLPPDYPMKPPSIMLLTPTGRFEVGTKICLSISGHHPETWQPSWSIRTVMLAIIGFMPTKGEGAIGSLDYTPEERKQLAKRSQEWTCQSCQRANKTILPKETSSEKSKEAQREAAKLASQISFKKEQDKKTSTSAASSSQSLVSSQPATAMAGAAAASRAAQASSPPPPSAAAAAAPNPYAAFNPAAVGLHFQPGAFQAYPAGVVNPQLRPPNAGEPPAAESQPAGETTQACPSSQASQSPPPPSSSTPASAASSSAAAATVAAAPQLRQRAANPSAAPATGHPQGDAQRRGESNSDGRWALGLMVLLTILMLFLLGRRLYLMYEYKFHSGGL